MALNPFHRSQMKIVEPLQLISSVYDGWNRCYKIEYRATRSAANTGLLAKQFKVGTPLVVNGKHVVVRTSNLVLSSDTVDEVGVHVEAVDFAEVLAQATGAAPAPAATNRTAVASVAAPRPALLGGNRRRILQ